MVQHKYKNCLICVRSASICIFKNLESVDMNQTLVNFNIENCLFYIGHVALAQPVACSNKTLTVYNSTSKQIICITFKEPIEMYRWYSNLFKLRYSNDTWSICTHEHLPTFEFEGYTKSLPSSPLNKLSLKPNNRRSSEIARMGKILGKIIKK
jgi:hypothetical protein